MEKIKIREREIGEDTWTSDSDWTTKTGMGGVAPQKEVRYDWTQVVSTNQNVIVLAPYHRLGLMRHRAYWLAAKQKEQFPDPAPHATTANVIRRDWRYLTAIGIIRMSICIMYR